MEYNIPPDYLPINLDSLRSNTLIGCDLYLLVSAAAANSRLVLYCRGDAVFENTNRDMLVAKRIKNLFINKEDLQIYNDYLENNFQDILSDNTIPLDQRTEIVQSAATNLLEDLYGDPGTANVKRTMAFAYNMVDSILQDGNVAQSLLKLAVHKYDSNAHSINAAAVGTLFARRTGLRPKALKGLCSGILLRDVGMIKVSTDILNKKGKLTKEEFEEIKKHPELGMEVLDQTGIKFDEERIVTLQHHENADGSGYPFGLKNNEIHHYGKISRIIDVYNALTKKRVYADAVRPFVALAGMKEKMLNCFDLSMFKEFIRFLGSYDPRTVPR
ncbi:MAG: HD domain-containing protein [Candidatus Brocadiales bacterium]|nr:HD domain-containing protein [Candidatus Brocadiales bacterium]